MASIKRYQERATCIQEKIGVRIGSIGCLDPLGSSKTRQTDCRVVGVGGGRWRVEVRGGEGNR